MLKDEKKIIKRHQKKLDSLIKEKNKENNIHENPNPVVTNLSSHDLSNEELSILKFGLKHGLATRPNESDILSYAEDIWEQIEKANICRSEMYSKAKIKNALRGFAFNLINIDETGIFRDSNKVRIIQQLRKNAAIMKPDKGNGTVLLDIKDYFDYVEHLYKDPKKFQILDTDPTVTRMKSLQSYLRT